MMKHKFLLFIGLFLFAINALSAQTYAVYFTDKSGTPYTLGRPSDFLSQRSLDRRARLGIGLTEEDLPVTPSYIEQVAEKGGTILWSSKWLNCVLARVPNDNVLNEIRSLNCVRKVEYIYPQAGKALPAASPQKPIKNHTEAAYAYNDAALLYGKAAGQIQQINGIAVHERGYQGRGVLVAVLDAGFANVNSVSAFRHLFDEDRIVLARDIVQPGNDIYHEDINSHGTSVLSCMAAYLPNNMVGTAPKASYCLIRTEDARSEYPIEEYNWVVGAELADSIGADILNSSLSYSTFSDPSLDHTYSEMDGKTAVSSIGAQKLLERGVFICVSAGNSGNDSSWPWIGAPADVSDALTVGAVDDNGYSVSFSSIGPNAAHAQKPNVVTRGANATIINKDGTIATTGSGTSYASPIACGMVACLIQACPEIGPASLKSLIEASSSKYTSPTNKMGYGIPNFDNVFQQLPICRPILKTRLDVYPNPTARLIHTRSDVLLTKAVVYDITGRPVLEKALGNFYAKIDMFALNSGLYILHLYNDKGTIHSLKVIKR